MFDISIYYKNGKRSYYDHVAQITNLTNENIVIDFITDFNDHLSKTLKVEEIERIVIAI